MTTQLTFDGLAKSLREQIEEVTTMHQPMRLWSVAGACPIGDKYCLHRCQLFLTPGEARFHCPQCKVSGDAHTFAALVLARKGGAQ